MDESMEITTNWEPAAISVCAGSHFWQKNESQGEQNRPKRSKKNVEMDRYTDYDSHEAPRRHCVSAAEKSIWEIPV